MRNHKERSDRVRTNEVRVVVKDKGIKVMIQEGRPL